MVAIWTFWSAGGLDPWFRVSKFGPNCEFAPIGNCQSEFQIFEIPNTAAFVVLVL